MIAHRITIQHGGVFEALPKNALIKAWAKMALHKLKTPRELTIRFVDEAEMTALNRQFRGKNYPTNVLSFPAEKTPGVPLTALGDIAIAPAVLQQEAIDQHKNFAHHCAHMVLHGTLHLLGYDHLHSEEAALMESKEIELLASLAIPNPYEFQDEN